jgi:hypothetical protein
MNEPTALTFKFQASRESVCEAMLLAGQALRVGKIRSGLMGLLSIISFIFVVAGAATTIYLLSVVIGFDATPAWIAPTLGGMIGAGLGLGWYDRMVRLMAAGVLETPFNRGRQEIQFDDRGVTLVNAQAHWHTTWSGVHGLKTGQQGLHIFISGVALTVPLAAFADQAGMTRVLEQIETLRTRASAP